VKGACVLITELLQTGIYTIPEAARLTDVSPWRIRRWLRGYEFKAKHGRHRSAPVWPSQLEPIDNKMALGFLDLLEIHSVDAFISAGVTWKTLREAHTKAQKLAGHSHPFCTHQFATDGRTVFGELREKNDEIALWDMHDLQKVFERIIRPFLKNVEFDSGKVPHRWWPRGKSHLVALDPSRSFGQPIVFRDGVPTQTLARSVKANGSVPEVARWFEISASSVREAVEFEQQLAA
jgi:uncharacterized protein (DUF433 family)